MTGFIIIQRQNASKYYFLSLTMQSIDNKNQRFYYRKFQERIIFGAPINSNLPLDNHTADLCHKTNQKIHMHYLGWQAI